VLVLLEPHHHLVTLAQALEHPQEDLQLPRVHRRPPALLPLHHRRCHWLDARLHSGAAGPAVIVLVVRSTSNFLTPAGARAAAQMVSHQTHQSVTVCCCHCLEASCTHQHQKAFQSPRTRLAEHGVQTFFWGVTKGLPG
jgi:hypothetical protein